MSMISCGMSHHATRCHFMTRMNRRMNLLHRSTQITNCVRQYDYRKEVFTIDYGYLPKTAYDARHSLLAPPIRFHLEKNPFL